MSDPWNNNQYIQGLPSQVKMFDPSQFQTPTAFGGDQASMSQQQQQPQPQKSVASTLQNTPSLQASHSSWNSWGNWDWNSENNVPHNVSGQQNHQDPRQNPELSQHQPVLSENAGTNQYYGAWNQVWDGSVQYAQQHQAYSHPETGAHRNLGQQLQETREYQGILDQGQYLHDPSAQQQPQQESQPQQHYLDGQFYDQQQQPTGDQTQAYNQFDQYPNQVAAYYDQPYGANAWGAASEGRQWGGGYPHQQELSSSGGQHAQVLENSTSESIAQPPSSVPPSHEHEPVLGVPSLEMYNDNDDDGTVSGFFGRDDDGDVQLDPHRHGQSGMKLDQDTEMTFGVNQFLAVGQSFHRTNSEISNASLSTLNMSSGDDDGKGSLQNVQELVHQLEEITLGNREGTEQDRKIAGGDLMKRGLNTDSVPGSASEQGQLQKQGDYSGFGNDHSAPPSNLPLNTGIRPSSPDGDQSGSAESGTSGGSGGSSGLTDWEIVPRQADQMMSHSQNSSLDNSANFFTDRPDGGGTVPGSQGNQSLLSTGESVQESFPGISSQQSSPHNTLQHDTFRPASLDARGRSGSPFIGALTDSTQENPSTHVTTSPPKPGPAIPPPSDPGALLTSPPQSDGAANPFRRDLGRSPRHASAMQPTKPPSASNSSSLPSSVPRTVDDRATNVSDQNVDSHSSKGITVLPSKPKIPSSSSVEDGNRVSRRDSEQSIKSTDSNSSKFKQPGEPPVGSNSCNSEEVALSSQQRRHHSAFYPVGRPRQTTMSPATTLWDNTETPKPNILLAPAMPLIIPGLNSYSAASSGPLETGKVDETDHAASKPESKELNTSSDQPLQRRSGKREEQGRGRGGRTKDDRNKSNDSLDEIDAEVDSPRSRNYRSQRDEPRDCRYRQDPDRRDFDKGDRPASRSGQYQYERPNSRSDAYSRDELYKRQRAYYRDYGEASFDERYDRPRSRQDESRGSRPSSRSGQEVDRPKSRADYDKARDFYYRDRPRGYGYDNYGRNIDYYNEERDHYYKYLRDREARYNRGYYEEYYGAKHAEYYQQQQLLQQQQQQQEMQQRGRLSSQEYERPSSRSSQSRGNTPAIQSRGHTPAMVASPGCSSDYYGHERGSRPSSRAEYGHEYYGRGYNYEALQAYYDRYGYDPYNYGYGYTGYDDYKGYDQGRMTPPKYSYAHVKACFGPNGQLVKVLPNRPTDGQPAVVEIQDLQTLLESCPEAEELRWLPGPLTRMNTHKKDVLLFCQKKSRACAEDINMVDRESAQLIWRFLELLIKQNGSVVGTDLADLLLDGQELSTHEYSLHGLKISQSPDNLDPVMEGYNEDNGSARGSPAVHVTTDRTVINNINNAEREREKWIDRFRHLLLYGRKKDALDCAMKNHLWGHALFLASKMDTRTHANVMTRFANSAMRMNDPLQTLYQLMSGRQPAAVTCVVDERWGDWRPHLAMILSNQTSRQDLDRKSICTLGDTLASKGCLHASHFCYMMAHVSFGNYFKKASKIVLIGSSHNLPMEDFATNEAIQCTEVYEYAQMLGNPAFCLPYFQTYKYLYACRLADYGMASEALHYCEVIASNIQHNPTWFQPVFVKLVSQLSIKLKYSDPQRQHTSEDAEDPQWMQQLQKIIAAYEDGSIQPLSGTTTPAGFPGTTTSSESGELSTYNYSYTADPTNVSSMTNTSGMDIYGNQTQQQYQNDSTSYYGNQDASEVTNQMQALDVTGIDQQLQQQQTDYSQQQYDYNLWQQQQQQQQQYGFHYGDQHQQQQQQQGEDLSADRHRYYHHLAEQQQQQHHHHQDQLLPHNANGTTVTYSGSAASQEGMTYGYDAEESSGADDKSSTGGTATNSSALSAQPPSHFQGQGYVDYGMQGGQQQLPPRASISTNENTEDEENDDDDVEEEEEEVMNAPASGFDYFGNVSAQKVVPPPHRYRSMSGSSTGSTRRRRTTSGSSTGSVKAAPNKPPQAQGSGKLENNKAKPGQEGNSWWLGGIFKKLGGKGKNEMILPDDKNPSIVWDPVKKKWTNADGSVEEDAPAAPPPKDTDLLGQLPSAAATAKSAVTPPTTSGGLAGSNRYSLKAKGARNQYVDVNNPKPVSVPQSLFNVMPGPSSASQTLQSSTDTTSNANNSNTSLDSTALLSVPGTEEGLSRSSSASSVSQEVQHFMAEASVASATTSTVPATTAPQVPVLFNPASLKNSPSSTGISHSAAGPGLKYGQRRAYPK